MTYYVCGKRSKRVAIATPPSTSLSIQVECRLHWWPLCVLLYYMTASRSHPDNFASGMPNEPRAARTKRLPAVRICVRIKPTTRLVTLQSLNPPRSRLLTIAGHQRECTARGSAVYSPPVLSLVDDFGQDRSFGWFQALCQPTRY